MEVLAIIFILMAVISISAIGLLFVQNGKYGNNKTLFLGIGMWSAFVSWMQFTSLPSNFIFQRVVALIFILIAFIAVILKSLREDKSVLSRSLMAISIAGGMIGLII